MRENVKYRGLYKLAVSMLSIAGIICCATLIPPARQSNMLCGVKHYQKGSLCCTPNGVRDGLKQKK